MTTPRPDPTAPSADPAAAPSAMASAKADLARALFAPRAVALVGASADPAKNTGRPQRFLRHHGFRGRVLPVNPGRAEVQGAPAYKDLAAAAAASETPIDHALVMVPAAAVPDVVAQCGAARVPVATVYSDGFAEAGADGRARQQALLEVARAAGVRLIGPNSMGLVNVHAAMPLSVNAALEAPALVPGGLSLITQSGTVLGTLLSRGQARGMGFAKLVSVGNEADLAVGEVLDLLVDDPETAAVLLFMETVRDAPRLAAAARRAFAAGKPVIAYKLGRSAAGSALAVSHSGAIVGADAAASAFFRRHAIIRVEMLETLLEMPPLVIGRKPAPKAAPPLQATPPSKGRVAVVTTTGGGAAMVVDRLGTLGMEPVPPPARLVERLAELGVRIGHGPLIDLTMAGTRPGVYGAALDELLAAPDCDAIVCVVGSSGQFHPELAVEPILKAPKTDKPLAVFIAPQADRSLALLAEAGIAAFRTPESCADAVRAALAWAPPAEVPDRPRCDLSAVEAALAAAPGPVLDAERAAAVFAALGVPCAASRVVSGPDDDLSGIAYPVAVKILSPEVAHRTETGGVVLNIPDEAALRDACRAILARVAEKAPSAPVSGIQVQAMERGLAEVLVGFRRDPGVGPVVVLGAGGILAEIHRDVNICTCPISAADAREMIAAVAGLAPLRGYRGLPVGDLEALAAALVAVSDLAFVDGPAVREAEVNPLLVRAAGAGVVAVDGLVVRDE